MDKFIIHGGRSLKGRVPISGSKNAALPALAATLLTGRTVTLDHVPDVWDVATMRKLLAHMGVRVERNGERVTVCAENIANPEAPYDIVKTMRASSLVLGPLLARCGVARVSLPGGCAIGARPIDLHIKGLEKLGAELVQEHGFIEARAPKGGLRGAKVVFDKITVTGTEDLMMAAVLAKGETVIENAAREPEVQDLALLLSRMGAKIQGAGTAVIRIKGVSSLKGAKHTVIPDRIEAGTFLVAGAITRGDLTLENCRPDHLSAVVWKLQDAGVEVTTPKSSSLRVRVHGNFRCRDMSTEEYPGFATDMQAQYMTLMTQADGAAVITENIFENRFMHVQELTRMGAQIQVDGRRAIVRGGLPLSGAAVMASDLRASASLVLAGLVAKGETVVERVYHLDRGYERMDDKLAAIGADIERAPSA